MKLDLKAVSIGGGCGAVQVLLGLRPYLDDLTGIIAVTDTGRSTGKVRSLADLPAPGDVRNALGTLVGNETVFTTQPGQTDGFNLVDHVRQIMIYLRGRLDYALINCRALSDGLRTAYEADGVRVLLPSDGEIHAIERMGVKPIMRDLAQLTDGKRELFDKQDSIRHDPDAVANVLMGLLDRR